MPPLVCYSTSFAFCPQVYPNSVETKLKRPLSFGLIWDICVFYIIAFLFSFKIGFEFVNPLLDLLSPIKDTKMVMATVAPNIQPRSHLFDEKLWKFIGCTVDNRVANVDKSKPFAHDPMFQEIFNKFEIVEKKSNLLENESNPNRLIYVSLGTLYNNNLEIYKRIIDAFKSFDEFNNNQSRIKLENLTIIVSTGAKTFEQFKVLLENNLYSLPNNIKLVKTAPQIEILKRASLFVTHCGLNSTSEAINYGVPVVCIPLEVDQPLNAYRIADELGLGIRLEYTVMTVDDIRQAIHKILNDKSFYQRMEFHSKVSKYHVGYLNGSRLVMDLLKKKN
jgi:UDP:flavonoid glycosyltransferase YjiC (YdhE family)